MRVILVCTIRRGLFCPGLKGSMSIRGEDTYERLSQLWVFITKENASLAFRLFESSLAHTNPLIRSKRKEDPAKPESIYLEG